MNDKIFTAIGANNHSIRKRANYDYYATDPIALEKLLQVETFNHNIWEPAAGEKHLSNVLEKYGYNVISSDIIDRTGDVEVLNFLESNIMWKGDILTNPPYQQALQFVQKALNSVYTGARVIMFLKLLFLEGQTRYNFFKENPPRIIYIFRKRVVCAPNGEFLKNGKKLGSAIAYAWFIWEKGFTGDPIIKWL